MTTYPNRGRKPRLRRHLEAVGRENLVTTWLAAHASPGSARDTLNASLGTRYDLARIGQWRRGDRTIPAPARAELLRAAIPTALERAGIDPNALYRLLRDPE